MNTTYKNKLSPADCKDSVDVSKLNEQGIAINENSLTVQPAFVTLVIGPTSIKISQHLFRKFAEWYLEEQEISSRVKKDLRNNDIPLCETIGNRRDPKYGNAFVGGLISKQ